MCGISGFWGTRFSVDEAKHILEKMGEAIKHRGPDDGGIWFDPVWGIGLSHRRLSIIELSRAGHQPMVSASGRYLIAFNGEIYNHLKLRTLLENKLTHTFPWRGHSDTETLLACIETWGLQDTLCKTVGMFAFALWDREQGTLSLARDRLGEKPLYYGLQKGVLLFGSELKALLAHPLFCAEIDRDALSLFLQHSVVPGTHSIYKGIAKLPPGTSLTIKQQTIASAVLPQPSPYWTLNEVIEHGRQNPFSGSDDDAITQLEIQLKEAIAQQQVADVPLGAFLSGGVDSSVIVALMQSQASRPVKTFTIGFHEKNYNEAEYAKSVANHLGTEHTELYVTPKQALDVIPLLPTLYDEPFADVSQIPTFLVAKMAREHVTVALSGDAGDELFGGYNRYLLAPSVWRKLSLMPQPLRKCLAVAMRQLSPKTWNTFGHAMQGILPRHLRLSQFGDKLHKLSELVSAKNPQDIYQQLVSHWKNPKSVVLHGNEPLTHLNSPALWTDTDNFEHWMMSMDTLTYLPDDILVKVDRAAMGVSLETRVPFLDHRVVELAWRMPIGLKIRNGQGKWLLRQVLYRYVPQELIERPKMGFSVPIDSWLRGPLKDWAEDLLSEQRLKQECFFEAKAIRKRWAEHLTGTRNWQYPLWNILMFQTWLQSKSKHALMEEK